MDSHTTAAQPVLTRKILEQIAAVVSKAALALLLGVAVAIIFAKHTHAAQIIEGRVIGVIDGDTLEVLDVNRKTHRIRLAGIDAPERSQSHGAAAKKVLSEHVYLQNVNVKVVDTDRYKRTIGRVRLNGEDINLRMVADGYAWVYAQYAYTLGRDKKRYELAQTRAQTAQRGLWGNSSAIPPWAFRRQHK